jgi:hypothetical protein
MAKEVPIIRKHLNADAMRETLRERFKAIEDTRVNPNISLADALMSGFAVFALKDPSLLAFDERRQDPDSNHFTVAYNHDLLSALIILLHHLLCI